MKIYTYKNSTQLKDTIFWKEIKNAPHFCATEVLAIGMQKFYGRNSFSCISTIDTLIKSLYPNWLKSYNDIKRYKDISKLVNDLDSSNLKDLKETFLKNKRSILESCKYLIESEDLLQEDWYNENLFNNLVESNDIQKIFKENILKKLLEQIYIDGDNDYWKPEWIDPLWTKSNLNDAIHKCIINEINNIIKSSEEKKFNHYFDEDCIFEIFNEFFDQCGLFNPSEKVLDRWKSTSQDELLKKINYTAKELEYVRRQATVEHNSYNTIVIHGVYRLNQIHLRLLKELERHYEVIILNCYNKDFNIIYKFWNDVYDNLIKVFKIPKENIKIDNHDCANHREIGRIFGEFINGIINEDKKFFKINRNDFGDELNLNSEHINELFNYEKEQKVLNILNKSKDSIYNYSEKEKNHQEILIKTAQSLQKELIHRGKILIKYDSTMQFVNQVSNVFDKTKNEKGIRSVARMSEQFYGSKGTELNKIFQVFYPDEFNVKPFLSYPIGQFIYAIHNMWDKKQQCLILNSKDLIECFNLDVWHNIHPLEVFDCLRVYIGIDKAINGMKVDEFIDPIIELIKFINENQGSIKHLNALSYFNLTIDQYNRFIQVIKNIEEIANKIFYNTLQTSQKHFMDLLKIIKDEKTWKPLSKEEKRLMDEIKDQISKIDNETNKTDLDTIKDTMAYYLDNEEGININWLVRDFDQLEGDILSESANYKCDNLKEKCYHFAMLSNENMIENDIEILPWPLNSDFVVSKDIYYFMNTIYINNVKYKRCLLFQGLYYLLNNPAISVKLSYIENQGDSKHNPYYILNMLMNIGNDIDEENHRNIKNCTSLINENSQDILEMNENWSAKAIQIFSDCQFKFIYGHIINAPIEYYKSELQVKMYIGEIIKYYIYRGWKRIVNENFILKSFNILEDWVNGKEVNLIATSLQDILKLICGNYFIDSEINKMIKDNFEHLKKQDFFKDINNEYKIKRGLEHCWWNKVSNSKEYSEKFNTRKRLYGIDANEYINNYILGLNDGSYLNNEGHMLAKDYKISEYICRYCSYNKICCYQYRLNPIHLISVK